MATEQQERTYIIPLRKAILKAPKYRRAKRAMSEIRIFLQRHLKTERVKIGSYLNEHMWNHGMRNPPTKIKVNAALDEEGVGYAELFGKPLVLKKEEKKKEKTEKKEEEKPKEEKPEEQKAGEAKPTAQKKGGSEPKLGKKALKEQLEKELRQKGEAAEKPAQKTAPVKKPAKK